MERKLYGQASLEVQNAVSDIQERYNDIQRLEKVSFYLICCFEDIRSRFIIIAL
jgi:t-SNARE complex subunit (syntaxin)